MNRSKSKANHYKVVRSIMLVFILIFAVGQTFGQCPNVEMQELSTSAVLTRYGFSELTNVSTPPARYLMKKIVDTRDYNDTQNITYTDTSGDSVTYSGVDVNNYLYITQNGIIPTNGMATNQYSGKCFVDEESYAANYDPNYDTNGSWADIFVTNVAVIQTNIFPYYLWSDGGDQANAMTAPSGGWVRWPGNQFSNSLPDVTVNSTMNNTLATASFVTTSSNYLQTGANILNDRSASLVTALSMQNTDGLLYTNLNLILPPYTNGGGNAYCSFADTNFLQMSGGKLTVQFVMYGGDPKTTYRVHWQKAHAVSSLTTNYSYITAMKPIDVKPTGDPSQPDVFYTEEIQMPQIGYPTLSHSISPSITGIEALPSAPPGSGGPN